MINEPILFILCPSGAGKTDLGKYLQEKLKLLHFDFDVWLRPDPIKDLSLGDEWDELYNDRKPKKFADKIRKRSQAKSCRGGAISFAGNCIFSKEFLLSLAPLGFRCVILYGTGADCLNSFLKREKANERGLDINHWLTFNTQSYATLSLPELEEFRLNVFNNKGRRPNSQILEEIKSRLS